jgi:hypothetical protein
LVEVCGRGGGAGVGTTVTLSSLVTDDVTVVVETTLVWLGVVVTLSELDDSISLFIFKADAFARLRALSSVSPPEPSDVGVENTSMNAFISAINKVCDVTKKRLDSGFTAASSRGSASTEEGPTDPPSMETCCTGSVACPSGESSSSLFSRELVSLSST